MADQTLHWPLSRTSLRRGRATSLAVVCSVVFHALVLGYLTLLGLSAADSVTPSGAMGPDVFPDGIPVELAPRLAGDGRPVQLSRVAPNTPGTRGMNQMAERSPDFHLPEPGRLSPSTANVPEPASATGPAAADTIPSGDGGRPDGFAGPTRFTGPPRTSALACRSLSRTLTVEEQAICDDRFARAASGAGRVTGTGNAARDARFAAEGAAALQTYEQRRLGLKPNSRANPCPGSPNPSDPCAVSIQGRIWSDRDGWFPDLPGRH
jgi:hypothetical protein